MKILVIQLARLGDIYMSWPTVRALKHKYSNAEIHMLVRPRFAAACEGLESLDKIKLFPTQEIISPLVKEDNIAASLDVIDQLIGHLELEKYDMIVNLSFSEVSSYLTSFLQTPKTLVSGYSRHSDGYLYLVDDVSRYFWAQVGPGGSNQIHIVDLMAGLAGVELSQACFRKPSIKAEKTISDPYFVVHLAASENHKQLSVSFWKNILNAILEVCPNTYFVLIGSESEKEKASQVMEAVSHRAINRVGQTRLRDVFGLLQYSEGLLGGDSAPMHMLSFVNQRGLCFSVGDVNPFETGPVTESSVVFRGASENSWSFSLVQQVAKQWALKNPIESQAGVYKCGDHFPRVQSSEADSFAWLLLKALYMGEKFPVASDLEFYHGALRMFEASQVSTQNLNKRNSIKKEFLTALLDRVDEILATISIEIPSIYPLFRWYQAEKTRIQPGTFEQMTQDHILIHQLYQTLLKKYLLEEDVKKAELHGSL